MKSSTRWRCTYFYLLRVGTTWCKEGERHPQLAPPLLCCQNRPGLQGWGGECVLGWHLLWQQRVKANLPGRAPDPAWPGLEDPPPLAIPTLIWLCSRRWREQLLPGFWGANSALLVLPWYIRPLWGPPVRQALLDTPCIVHPVPTYGPCPVSSILQS